MSDKVPTGAMGGQVEYWNSDAGNKWVANQERLDRQLGILTDRLFEHTDIQVGERIIDIGCGTGATILRSAPATGTGGTVLGLDISHPMLDLARKRSKEQGGMAHLELRIADAQNETFDPGGYDLIMSRFGVMFFDDPVAAFANLLSALRPGGRLCFVCWGPLANNPWFNIPRTAAIQYLGTPAPAQPRAAGPMAFAETDYVMDILTGAGYADIRIETETCDLVGAATVKETANISLNTGPAYRLLKSQNASPEIVASIEADIETAFAPYLQSDAVKVPAELHFVHAKKV